MRIFVCIRYSAGAEEEWPVWLPNIPLSTSLQIDLKMLPRSKSITKRYVLHKIAKMGYEASKTNEMVDRHSFHTEVLVVDFKTIPNDAI